MKLIPFRVPVPIVIVEGVEVLLGVTSAVYGADAKASPTWVTEYQESRGCKGGGEESGSTRHLIFRRWGEPSCADDDERNLNRRVSGPRRVQIMFDASLTS